MSRRGTRWSEHLRDLAIVTLAVAVGTLAAKLVWFTALAWIIP